jgi:Fur family ferric uptake transcriptional regulator
MTKGIRFHRRALLEELAARGVRMTAQRRAVVETMQEAEGHLDAASLLELAGRRAAGLDRATVYRTIELLKRHGLIDELDLMHVEGEKHYYEVKTEREHAHVTCVECGRVEEFGSPMLERVRSELAEELGFEVEVARLEVGGRCAACREKARKAGQAA